MIGRRIGARGCLIKDCMLSDGCKSDQKMDMGCYISLGVMTKNWMLDVCLESLENGLDSK